MDMRNSFQSVPDTAAILPEPTHLSKFFVMNLPMTAVYQASPGASMYLLFTSCLCSPGFQMTCTGSDRSKNTILGSGSVKPNRFAYSIAVCKNTFCFVGRSIATGGDRSAIL